MRNIITWVQLIVAVTMVTVASFECFVVIPALKEISSNFKDGKIAETKYVKTMESARKLQVQQEASILSNQLNNLQAADELRKVLKDVKEKETKKTTE